jgi:hypothetical protein
VFSSNFTTPALSFTGVLAGNSEQKQPHLCQDVVGGLIGTETAINEQQQERSQEYKYIQFVLRQYAENSDCSTARQQVMTQLKGTDRSQSSGHYKTCLIYDGTKWQIGFIGPSKS